MDPNDIRMPLTGAGKAQTGKLTIEQHQTRHVHLHRALDELVADYIDHNFKVGGKTLTTTSIMDLMRWSYEQTQNPTQREDD